MICHHYRCIFIHIPKNAGQSIEHVFLDLLGLNWKTRAPLLLRYNDRPELGPPRLAHLKADEYVRLKYLTGEMFNDYFKFAIVRNPWSRMVSIYKYLGYDRILDFKTFLVGEFKNKIFKDRYWFVGPQSEFVYGADGKPLVDFIGRFEDLQNSFNFICKEIGLPPTRLPYINKSKKNKLILSPNLKIMAKNFLCSIKVKRIPSYANYQEYYDKKTIDVVAEIYQKDIKLFGYDFDQSKTS